MRNYKIDDVSLSCSPAFLDLSRNSSVLCSRLCMRNKLRSRNSPLKSTDFTTVRNNQLTIAHVEKAARNGACFYDFDRLVS